VRLVHDDEMPVAVGELVQQLLGARELVHARDQQRVAGEDGVIRARGHRRVDEAAVEDGEVEVERVLELLRLLLHQAARGDDEAPGHSPRSSSSLM